MTRCKVCDTKEDLIKVKDEQGEITWVCEGCYESVCEGYERIDEQNQEKGGV